MKETEAVTLLKNSSLFRDINNEYLKKIAYQLKEERFPKGSFPYDGNKTFRKFYIIKSGRIKLFQINRENERQFTIYILSAGDVFDILTLLDGNKHEIFTEAIDDIEIYSTAIENAQEWLKECPGFNKSMLPYLAYRMRLLEQTAVDMVLTETCYRLAKLILSHINVNSTELTLINNLSHSDLAHMIGTTRTVINRHLQELKKEGIIQIERKHIYIKNLELLQNKIDRYL